MDGPASCTTRVNGSSWRSRWSWRATTTSSRPPTTPAIRRPGPATHCSCRRPGRSSARCSSRPHRCRARRSATRPASTPSGTTRPAPGRRTTASASTTCCCRRRPPTGWRTSASTATCAPGRSRPTTCRSGSTYDRKPLSHPLNAPTLRRRPRPPAAASPIARPRPARCLPRSRRSRIAARGKAGRAARISSLPRCGA